MGVTTTTTTRRTNGPSGGGISSQSFLLQVGAAAVATGISALLAYRYRGSTNNNKTKKSASHLDLPPELLASPYGRELKVAVELALAGT
jgi:hypothetical protein